MSAHRRFTFGQLPLDDVKAVKSAHGVTVNDVVVTICAAAVRRWLTEHGELPAEPLVAQIPVSVRTDTQDNKRQLVFYWTQSGNTILPDGPEDASKVSEYAWLKQMQRIKCLMSSQSAPGSPVMIESRM